MEDEPPERTLKLPITRFGQDETHTHTHTHTHTRPSTVVPSGVVAGVGWRWVGGRNKVALASAFLIVHSLQQSKNSHLILFKYIYYKNIQTIQNKIRKSPSHPCHPSPAFPGDPCTYISPL